MAFFAITARRQRRLPRQVAAGNGDPGHRSGADVPDAERRRGGLGPGTALRGRDRAELGCAPARCGARRRGADRDPRQPEPAGGSARLRAWLAVRGRLLSGGALVCLGLVVRRTGRRSPSTAPVAHSRSSPPQPQPHGGYPRRSRSALRLPSLAESEGERAECGGRRRSPSSCATFPSSPGSRRGCSRRSQRSRSTVSLRRGEWLFREGRRRPTACTSCGSGTWRSCRSEAEPETINTLTRGAVLGELALLSDSLRSASVRGAARQRAADDRQAALRRAAAFRARARAEPDARSERAAAGKPRDPGAQARSAGDDRAARARARACPLLELADELSRAMCAWGRVAVLHTRRGDAGHDRRTAKHARRDRDGSHRLSSAASSTTTR